MSKPLNDISSADRKFCCGGDSQVANTMRSAAIPALAVAGVAGVAMTAPLWMPAAPVVAGVGGATTLQRLVRPLPHLASP